MLRYRMILIHTSHMGVIFLFVKWHGIKPLFLIPYPSQFQSLLHPLYCRYYLY